MNSTISNKLGEEFYTRNVNEVAKDLLGKTLVRIKDEFIYSGTIVETEAYDWRNDLASHSFGGPTKRNNSMFEIGGTVYVYLIYGMYSCLNVVTGDEGFGSAVLIRAIEPINGISKMVENRFGDKTKEFEIDALTNGPGKICKAFEIDRRDDGKSFLGNELYLKDDSNLSNIAIGSSKRIGISKSVELKWRYFVKDSKFLSRK